MALKWASGVVVVSVHSSPKYSGVIIIGGQAILLGWYLLSVLDSHVIEIDQLTINIGIFRLRRGPDMSVDVLHELRRLVIRLFADLTSLRAMLSLTFLKSSGASKEDGQYLQVMISIL